MTETSNNNGVTELYIKKIYGFTCGGGGGGPPSFPGGGPPIRPECCGVGGNGRLGPTDVLSDTESCRGSRPVSIDVDGGRAGGGGGG